MPFVAGDAKRHIKGLNPTQAAAWAKIANRALSDCEGGDCEGKAIRIANAQAKQVGKIAKLDEDRRQVFGWAYVTHVAGEQVVDHSGEYVDDIAELEAAMYEYVLKSREANDMHGETVHGQLIESVVVTPEKLVAWGLAPDAMPHGAWIGLQLDDDAFQKVKAGNREMFSIEGAAVRHA